MRQKRRALLAVACCAATLALTPASADAQNELEGPSISLSEAIDRTLRNSFELQRAEEDVNIRRGSLQEFGGLFDGLLYFDSSFTFRQEALLRPERTGEIRRRLPLEFLAVATLDGPPGILDRAADGIQAGLPTAGSLLFDECTDFQTQLVIDIDDGRSVTVCLSSDLALQGVVIDRTEGREIAELLRLLQIIQAMGDDIERDIEEGFTDLLRTLALDFRFIADILRVQLANLGTIPEEQQFLNLRMELGRQWRFRNGIAMTSSLLVAGSEINYADKPLSPRLGDTGSPNTFTTSLGLNLNVPLAKGRGRIATAGQESALEVAVQAEQALLAHNAATEAIQTIEAYWNLAAAQARVEIAMAAADIEGTVLESARVLIDADELAGAELYRAQSRYAEVQSQVAVARQELVAARLTLLEAMGQTTSRLEDTPLTSQELPEVEDSAAQPELPDLDDWVERGFDRRQDLVAAAFTIDAADILARSSKANARHQVDLAVNVSFSGFEESFTERLYDLSKYWDAVNGRISGPSYGIGLRWAIPFKNRAAKGRLQQARATLDRSRITEEDLRRQMRLTLSELIESLEHQRAELVALDESMGYLEQTLEASIERFRGGDLTLIDVLTAEQQLTEVRASLIEGRRNVALLEAQIQFESGQLLTVPDDYETFDPAELELLAFNSDNP